MSREQKRVKQEKGSDDAEKVVVAVKASKEIPKTALVWALTHVVQPGDCITLLVVVPSQSSGNFSLQLIFAYFPCSVIVIGKWVCLQNRPDRLIGIIPLDSAKDALSVCSFTCCSFKGIDQYVYSSCTSVVQCNSTTYQYICLIMITWIPVASN